MKKPAIALEGKTPESIMVTNDGMERVSDLLGQIGRGVVV
jgi:uncharacterized protein (DUF2384 family)